MDLVPAVQTCTSRVENVSAHDPYLRTRPRDYSSQLLNRHICALTIPAATYVTAQRVRRIICQEFEEALARVQVLVAPTVAIPPPTVDECQRGFVDLDGKQIKFDSSKGSLILCTLPFNVTGLPALSICCGFSTSGLPIGMQIIGGPFEEQMVFRIAHAYERAAGFYERTPRLP